jgi:hypothetical protein
MRSSRPISVLRNATQHATYERKKERLSPQLHPLPSIFSCIVQTHVQAAALINVGSHKKVGLHRVNPPKLRLRPAELDRVEMCEVQDTIPHSRLGCERGTHWDQCKWPRGPLLVAIESLSTKPQPGPTVTPQECDQNGAGWCMLDSNLRHPWGEYHVF